MKNTFVMIAVCTVLSSCGLFKPEPVKVTVYEPVPAIYIEKVSVPEPPKPEEYMKMPWTDKERALNKVIQDAYRSINQANNQFQALQEYNKGLADLNRKSTGQ